MEFPGLGEHCALATCKQLDFLPARCDGCQKMFCQQHVPLETHACPAHTARDVRVPVCPMCQQPVPVTRRGDAPDIAMTRHLDGECRVAHPQSATDKTKAKTAVVDDGRTCSKRKCKQREMIPLPRCDECQKKYCLKHRHAQDHDCPGRPVSRLVSQPAANPSSFFRSPFHRPEPTPAAAARSSSSSSSMTTTAARPAAAAATKQREVQGQMSEDEALARALQASLAGGGGVMTQEEQDRMAALSLQESLNNPQAQQQQQQQQQNNSSSSNKSCNVS